MRTVVVGGQFGDEGKGKIVGYIAMTDKPEVIARGGVGPNAGHKVHWKGKVFSVRMVPSGFVYEDAYLCIGAGVVVNPKIFLQEVEMIGRKVFVDYRATAILPKHLEEDKSELSKKIGTTRSGSGPAMEDRIRRSATLVGEIEELKDYLTDVPKKVNQSKNVLIEGTQGFMLSVLYGTYPYVTSKDVSASTIAADVGLGPKSIDEVVMVIKSYTTRVGNGPLKDEISVEEAEKLGYQEYGTVTGRPRRTSPNLHYSDLRYAAMINSATQIALTKIDVRFPGNERVRKYSDLTARAKEFIEEVEKKLEVPVTLIGTGPEVEDVIDRRDKI